MVILSSYPDGTVHQSELKKETPLVIAIATVSTSQAACVTWAWRGTNVAAKLSLLKTIASRRGSDVIPRTLPAARFGPWLASCTVNPVVIGLTHTQFQSQRDIG